MRRLAKVVAVITGVVIGVIIVEEIIETALMTWAFRTRSPRAIALLTSYNRHVSNPVMVRFFSGRSAHAALLQHVGRRSGKPYETPVTAHRTNDTIIVPLPYGTQVDWLRNLQAAGGGVVKLEGRSFSVDQPEVVPIDRVMPLLPRWLARIVQLHDTTDAVRLHVSGRAERLSA